MIDPDGRAPDTIGVDKIGNIVFDNGKNDGNLFLIKDDVKNVMNSKDLLKNAVQLAENNIWVGNDNQLIEYVKSKWNHEGNGLNSLIFVLDTKVSNTQNAFSVNTFEGKKDAFGNILVNAKPLDDVSFTIHYKKGKENPHLSNPYNTRNALGHEKQHIKQGITHYHQEKGWTKDYRSARELDAIEVQKTLPSWLKTTPEFKSSVELYKNKWK